MSWTAFGCSLDNDAPRSGILWTVKSFLMPSVLSDGVDSTLGTLNEDNCGWFYLQVSARSIQMRQQRYTGSQIWKDAALCEEAKGLLGVIWRVTWLHPCYWMPLCAASSWHIPCCSCFVHMQMSILSCCTTLPFTMQLSASHISFQYDFPGSWNQGWEQEGFSAAQCFHDCNSVVCRYCQCFLFSLSSSWCFFAAARWSHKLCLMAGSSSIQKSVRVGRVLAWLSQMKVSPLMELIFKSWGESYLF